MISYFTGKVVEEKWQCGYRYGWGEGFRLNERYYNMCCSVGYSNYNAKEYNRITQKKFYQMKDYPILLKKGDKVKIQNTQVIIEDVIYNLNGSITYHTSKEIKRIIVKSKEEAEDESQEKYPETTYDDLNIEPNRTKFQKFLDKVFK